MTTPRPKYHCPSCRATDGSFQVTGTAVFQVNAAGGIEDFANGSFPHLEYDYDSTMLCNECDYSGPVRGFIPSEA